MRHRKVAPLSHNPSLQEFLAHHIQRAGLTNREVARACGFRRPNVVSMIKHGHTRLPLERLGAMANILEIDAFNLYCRFMHEYFPDTWEDLKPLIPGADQTLFDS